MVKKSTTSIRESKSKRYKLKKKICKLLDSTNKEDFLIGLELCSNLSEMEFRNILKSCEDMQKVDINGSTTSKNGAVYFYKDFGDEVFQYTDGYSQILANHYIEYGGKSIFLDPKEYVMDRIRFKKSVKIHSIFLNKDLEKEFIKNNPDYEQYFKRKD